MSASNEDVQAMVRKATGTIPQNPEIQAKLAIETLPTEQPATPPAVEPAVPAEQGLDPSTADFFGNLAADMDSEVSGVQPEPLVPTAIPIAPRAPVEELPYEPPVHQRQPGEIPESLVPQVGPEGQPLEAAIEQPLVEEEIRLTADQWATQQQTLAPAPQVQPVEQLPVDPAKLQEQAIEQLTTTMYALSDEDKNALIAEPDKVLPGLAARMHVTMQVQLAQQIAQILPGIIQGQLQQAHKVQGLETSFFGQYPELNKPQYKQTVQESLSMIRQVNPQASREEVMRDGAALAAVRLRTKLATVQESVQQPALPQTMPLAQPAVAQQPAPFTPAQSGGGSEPVVPTDPNQGNIFEQLANDPDW